jgi:serine/threonine-protein kinase
VILGIIFIVILFVISQVFQLLTGGQQSVIAIGLSALVFGSLFQPARQRVQHFVDQKFYGIQVGYQERISPDPITSDVLADPTLNSYIDLERIGRGGMAEVYKAQHPTTQRAVAIKILLEHLVQDQDHRKRFEREAQTIASLKHPNIVQVFEFGEVGSNFHMVMEYISGPDLSNFLREHGRLTLAHALPLFQDIANALDYAHAQGIVHRDIKPSNVMLRPVPASFQRELLYQAVLMDFGIARIVDTSTRLTRTGVLGTMAYIAPEQIKAAIDVDGRADIYSLGVMIYEILTGRLPFNYQNPGALLIAHLHQPPPEIHAEVPDLPSEISDVLQQAMAKSPDERYKTAGELVQALV